MKARKIRREKTKEEDDSKTCPICSKSFVNGKALGGHLRAHFAKHPLTPGPEPEPIAPVPPPTGSRVLPNRNSPLLEPAADRRRSARANRARAAATANSAESTRSHDSETLSEEDGALCLMMLARDSWTRKSGTPPLVTALRPEELYQCVENDVLGHKTTEEVDLEPGEYVGYECEFCNKVFESEAEHRKLRLSSCCVQKCSAKLSSIIIDLNRLPV